MRYDGAKGFALILARSVVLGVAVFIPVFILSLYFELNIRGFWRSSPNNLAAAFFHWLVLSIPVTFGSIVYGSLLLCVSALRRRPVPRSAQLLLATTVPLAVVLPDTSGALLLVSYASSTLVATLAFGLVGLIVLKSSMSP